MLLRRIATHPIRPILLGKGNPPWRSNSRSLSTTTPTTSTTPTTPTASPLPHRRSPAMIGLMAELDQIAPRIDIRADQIEVIDSPAEFYTALKSMIRKAKRRIFLSTLYIGKTEHELVSEIRHSLRANPDLKVSILTDALRGTRESPEASCASLLASLTEEFPERVETRMYHTPNLTGLRKRFIPKRINEGWGLQHIKLYGFDDELILSGANLSNDYFTNRQDRYHVFTSQRVTDYFADIHNAVCSASFLLKPADNPAKYTLEWPSSNPAPSPLTSPEAYIKATTSLLRPFTTPSTSHPRPETDTSFYPLLCQPPNLNTELPALRAIIRSPSLCAYTFTAGYFNPHPLVTAYLLSIQAPGTILTASPFANGFYNSSGVSSLLPAAYSHLSLRFLRAARSVHARISLREWRRGTVGEPDGWTYHAKGLWVTLLQSPAIRSAAHHQPGDAETSRLPSVDAVSGGVGPCATVVGSSNYTKRSYGLDLEAGALVVSSNEGLMKRWKREEEQLVARSRMVEEDELAGEGRRAGWNVRVAMWIVKVLGGEL